MFTGLARVSPQTEERRLSIRELANACVRALYLMGILLALCFSSGRYLHAQLVPTRHVTLSLPENTRTLLGTSMQLFDQSYDSNARLLRRPAEAHGPTPTLYLVRESSWYALGLLLRARTERRPNDVSRAIDILNKVLDQQYLDPAAKWYGTFKRSPEDTTPLTGDLAFTSYDPNWREFLGTTLQMLLIEFPSELPSELKTRMYAAIELAIKGEQRDGRLLPSYSNIALMYGALWDFAATHDGNTEWRRQARSWTDSVSALFKEHDTFSEYNAPTYYGVDLYGLALWREYSSSPRTRSQSRYMETALWRDIAAFYNPPLHNLSGPFDRSYGMDMRRYVSVTGLWMRSVMDPSDAPFPKQCSLVTDHVADIWFAPQIALLGTRIPPETLRRLRTASGPHLLTRRIDANRIATSWISPHAMWGGESTDHTRDTGKGTQFHPATAQWRTPGGGIEWLKITKSPNIDVKADRSGLGISTSGDVTFRVFSDSTIKPRLTKSEWGLPGMPIHIDGDGDGFTVVPGSDCEQCFDVTYSNVSKMRLQMHVLAE